MTNIEILWNHSRSPLFHHIIESGWWLSIWLMTRQSISKSLLSAFQSGIHWRKTCVRRHRPKQGSDKATQGQGGHQWLTKALVGVRDDTALGLRPLSDVFPPYLGPLTPLAGRNYPSSLSYDRKYIVYDQGRSCWTGPIAGLEGPRSGSVRARLSRSRGFPLVGSLYGRSPVEDAESVDRRRQGMGRSCSLEAGLSFQCFIRKVFE